MTPGALAGTNRLDYYTTISGNIEKADLEDVNDLSLCQEKTQPPFECHQNQGADTGL